MRTWAEEVKMAESLRTNPPLFIRQGLHCQQSARVIVGASAWADTALKAWNAIPAEHKVPGKYVPGGISYWDYPHRTGETGHAAWNYLSGKVYSTDIIAWGHFSVVPYTMIHEKWGMRYLGTILWTPSGTIAKAPVTPAPSPTVVSPWSKGAVYQSKLHYGQRASDSVKRLQYRLRALGYSKTVTITGNYDSATDSAVRSWQKRIGHTPDQAGHSFLGPIEFRKMFPVPPYVLYSS